MVVLDAARVHVFSDFDGTISEPDTLQFLTEQLGGGPAYYRETGRMLEEGRLTLRAGVARDIGSLRVPFAEAAARLRAGVRVDPGFAPFARWCVARRLPLTVLSAGFEEIIALFVPPGDFPAIEVRANRLLPGTWECRFRDDSPLGHDKAAALMEARTRGQQTVFVGDGFSDREAATVADLVFARRGRGLAEHCRRHGIAHEEFDGFEDVHERLRGLVRHAA